MSKADVAVIVLAAGASTRFGRHNKLLAEIDGVALVRRVANICLSAAPNAPMIAVVATGQSGADVTKALGGLPFDFVENAEAAAGLSTSVRAGILTVPADCSGALIVQGDMPGLTTALIAEMMTAFEATTPAKVVVATTTTGKRKTPVLWPRAAFAEFETLSGDTGARHLLERADQRGDVIGVTVADDQTLADIDTQDELAAWQSAQRT